jgi:predicted short-subunit dehydrogenase-like oxidoreductase (DUF2520 family)
LKPKWASIKRLDHSRKLHVVIIGGGRVGQTLGRLLVDQGYVIESVVCRTLPHARAARRFTSAQRASNRITMDQFPSAQIVFITTPDAHIAPTALFLSRLAVEWKGKFIFHTSGALSSRELATLSAKGARVASLHPLQTFPSPREGVKRVKGIFYTFEGDPGTEDVARRLVGALGGCLVRIEARDKPLYHCAGTFACGGLLALLSVAYELYGKMGIDEKTARAMLKPMVNATVDVAQISDLRKTITGPISRGDAATIAGHIQALSEVAPEFGTLYKSMSLRLLELVGTSIPKAKSNSIRRLLTGRSRSRRSHWRRK